MLYSGIIGGSYMQRRYAYNVVDLFSGAGGLSLGAARAGFAVRGAVDIDPEATSAHKRNFPNTVHLQTDVSKLNGRSLRSSLDFNNGDFAGIIGGPPCQGFSSIGKRDKDDARNKLFEEFFRIVAEALPTFFLAENVPGIMREDNNELRNKAFSHVEEKYVILPPMAITASDYGAPTTRTRIFFFGYLPDEMEALTTDSFKPPAGTEKVLVKDALRGLPTKINPHWRKEEQGWRVVHVHGNGYYASRLHGRVPPRVGYPIALERLRNESRASGFLGTIHSTKVAERYAKIECGKYDSVSKSYRLDPNGFCPTLRAGTGPDQGSFQAVRPLHPTESRVITPREAARLQGFPDWFQFSPTKWHSFRQIGSSVSPIIAERILAVIRRALRLDMGRDKDR
jgi:DNA (cytosine-5)-methyltransferase 1